MIRCGYISKISALIFLVISITVIVVFPCNADDTPTRILFVGNSLIYTNDLPNILKEICEYNGKSVSIDHSTVSGFSISEHINYKLTIGKLENSVWDYLIFNEYNYLLINPDKVTSNVIPSWEKLDALLKRNKIGKVLVFGNWGFRNGVDYTTLNSYKLMQDHLTNTLTSLSSSFGYGFLPIGDCWGKLLENNRNLQLWTGDEIHPTFLGSYVTASVIYSYIFKEAMINSKYKPNKVFDEILLREIHQTVDNMLQ